MKKDDGFTLVELLVSVVILGVIAFPLGNLVLAYFKNTTATSVRVNESYDSQLTAAYFAQDVGSVGTRTVDITKPAPPLAQSVWTNVPNGGGATGCGTFTAVVLMVWDDAATPGQTNRVAYVQESSNTELHRLYCVGSATPTTDVKVARDVDPAVTPGVACVPTGCTIPTQMTLTFSVKDPADTGSTDLVVAVTGQRRST